MKNNFDKKNVLASYTNLFITILSALILVPIIETNLGKNYYGIYQFVFSLAVYTELMSLGLGKTVERYVAKYSQEEKEEIESATVSIALSIYMFTGLLYLAGVAILYSQFGNIFNFSDNEIEIAKICFLIAAFNAVLNVPASLFFYHLRGRGRFAFVFNMGTIKAVLRVLIIILILHYGYGMAALFVVELILVQSVNLIFAYVSLSKYRLSVKMFYFEKQLFNKLFQYTTFVFLIGVAELLYWNTDNIILGIFTNAEIIAEYALSQRLLSYFFMYSIAFSGLFLPLFMEHYVEDSRSESNDRIIKLFITSSRVMGILMSFAIVNFLVLGHDFIMLWIGPRYSMTFVYTVIILIPYGFVLSQSPGIEMLYVMKKHKARTYILLVSAAFNISITVYLVQVLGAVGAAVATSVTLFMGNFILLNIYYRRLLSMDLGLYLREVFLKNVLISSLVLFYGHVLNSLIPQVSVLHFVVKGSLLNVLFIPLLGLILLSLDERRTLLKKITSTLKLTNTA